MGTALRTVCIIPIRRRDHPAHTAHAGPVSGPDTPVGILPALGYGSGKAADFTDLALGMSIFSFDEKNTVESGDTEQDKR